MKYITARQTKNSDTESSDFLYINNCGAFFDLGKTLNTSRPHGRMDYQLIYIANGSLETEGGERAENGCVMLFRPHEPQIYRVDKGSSFYWIHFSGTTAGKMLEFFKENVYKVGAFPEFEEFCKETVNRFAAGKVNYDLFCKGQLISLIARLSEKLEMGDTAAREQLSAALFDIHTNFTVMRTNDEYASMCGLSKSHFIRLFHGCMQMPPQKYRTEVAMREAKHLLRSNSVNDVAALLGYEDVFYFSRVFKKHTGRPPSAYREK